MAFRRHTDSKRRALPYYLNLSVNWTATKLRSEIAALGVHLNATTIPKSAHQQIYIQLSSVNNNQHSQVQVVTGNTSSMLISWDTSTGGHIKLPLEIRQLPVAITDWWQIICQGFLSFQILLGRISLNLDVTKFVVCCSPDYRDHTCFFMH